MHSRLEEAEGRIRELEDRVVEVTKLRDRGHRIPTTEEMLRELCNSSKCDTIRIFWFPEGEERDKGGRNIVKK